jgi:gamma-glutamyltranspeptidase / glutathione hydrolase
MVRIIGDKYMRTSSLIMAGIAAFTLAAGPAQAEALGPHPYMVAAANPHAVEAGRAVLAAGGTAADAAVAVQSVLTLVEPQSSGIGGGAFILYWDESTSTLHTIDGRETAPATATPGRFLGPDGKKLGFWDSVVGGQSVGVPGTLAALDITHRLFGQKSWASGFEQAISLASNGFEVSPRMAKSVARAKHLKRFETARNYFFDDAGEPLGAGTQLRNQPLAETLTAVAGQGVKAFYEGPIAADIVAAINATSTRHNNITLADLAGYRAKMRAPVCAPYRGYDVCGMGPPTSGGLTVGQILGMLSNYDVASMGWGPELAHLLTEVEKRAYADRGLYMADSDYVPMPLKGLLDAEYLKSRTVDIDLEKASEGKASPGVPPGAENLKLAMGTHRPLAGTSHFVVRDSYGNAISMTTTIESGFGSRVMVRGFMLNNELTDFSREPTRDGKPVANRVEGGKRPRSSMSPTIVMRRGHPHLLIGSPGGSRIPGYVAQALIGILDLGMTPQAAINMGHVVHRNMTSLDVEAGTDAEALAPNLAVLGHKVKARNMTSGLHAILIKADGTLEGAADPRREGTVAGN